MKKDDAFKRRSSRQCGLQLRDSNKQSSQKTKNVDAIRQLREGRTSRVVEASVVVHGG